MTTSSRSRPDTTEYAPFFHNYISSVPEGDVLTLLRESGRKIVDTLAAVPESRGGFRYGEGKWSIREVVGHLSDAERVFSYRAMRIARGDATPLPPFDENTYVPNSGAEARTLANLITEFAVTRESTALLLESLPADAWVRRGIVSEREISVRAIAYVLVGHPMHHLRILRERYEIG
jgi:hypothetical protein